MGNGSNPVRPGKYFAKKARKERSDKLSAEQTKAHGYESEAKKRTSDADSKRPRVWDRERPPESAILDPAEAIRLIPGYDPQRDAEGYRFDPDVARRVVRWFHVHLTHVKGDLTRQPYVLEPIEQAILMNLFGWLNEDGLRRYRKALIYVARKFSKTTLCAGISLFGFFEERGGCSCSRCGPLNHQDGDAPEEYVEGGVEAYAAAYSRDQAKLLWGPATMMIRRDEALSGRCRIYQHSVVRYEIGTTEDDGSYFKATSADANSAHGYNPSIYTVDELWNQPKPDLLDALDTGIGSRAQPLGVRITTADYWRASVCNEEYDKATKVRDGVTPDARYLPVIFEASPDDDPYAEATWRKANPKFPATPTRAFMEEIQAKARDNPRFFNEYLRLHLNIRTNSEVAWFDLETWDECAREPEASGPCFAGLDLSKSRDLTALALYWPETHSARVYFWIPDAGIEHQQRDNVPYVSWVQHGHITKTEGDVTDYDVVEQETLRICAEHGVSKLGYDPWNATASAIRMQQEGLELAEFRQGYRSISEPSKELERMVLAKQFRHGGNPVLRWNASNVMVRTDPAGNIKPDKQKSTGRIDGVIAVVMAIGLAIAAEVTPTSNLETHGLRSF